MTLIHGDCLVELKKLADCSVDAIVTDPPAGISFMGRKWDGDKGGRDQWVAWLTQVMSEALRVLKPGGHALVWSLPRTSHWTGTALENAGFEVRDCVYHLFGAGFPKSLDVGKQIDKQKGAKREVIGERIYAGGHRQRSKKPRFNGNDYNSGKIYQENEIRYKTTPATPAAEQWDGWGSALKPAVECWWLCRKPLAESSITANVLAHGTGAINIEASRIGSAADLNAKDYDDSRRNSAKFQNIFNVGDLRKRRGEVPNGRFPAHLLISHTLFCTEDECWPGCPAAELNEQSGYSKSTIGVKERAGSKKTTNTYGNFNPGQDYFRGHLDEGGASRYFTQFYYASKASKSERNAGLDQLPEGEIHRYKAGIGEGLTPEAPVVERNIHPTVKPLKLMRWLVKLITPPGGIVLDMFGGSGTTALACIAEGMDYVLIEREAAYIPIIEARIAHAEAGFPPVTTEIKGKSERIAASGWGKTVARCPIHDGYKVTGGNNYSCGCKFVYTKEVS